MRPPAFKTLSLLLCYLPVAPLSTELTTYSGPTWPREPHRGRDVVRHGELYDLHARGMAVIDLLQRMFGVHQDLGARSLHATWRQEFAPTGYLHACGGHLPGEKLFHTEVFSL